jgi:hypothetical protein
VFLKVREETNGDLTENLNDADQTLVNFSEARLPVLAQVTQLSC